MDSKHKTLRPVGANVVVRRDPAEAVTAGGIVLPDEAQEKPRQGTVIAVGPGKLLPSGERQPIDVQVGDTVIFTKYSGNEVRWGGEDLLVLAGHEVLVAIGG